MAGFWIKVEHELPDKPEVWEISDRLDLDPDAVVGKLLRVWIWFDNQSRNGNAPSVTKKILDRIVGVTGFIDACIEAGWFMEINGRLVMVNFDRHNSKTAKQRALTAKRVQSHRGKNRNGDSVTDSLPDTDTDTDKEKLNKKKPATRSKPNDPALEEQFEQFWQHWPKKVKKPEALKAFKKAINSVTLQTLVEDIQKRLDAKMYQTTPERKPFIPNPATYLNQEMWKDDVVGRFDLQKKPEWTKLPYNDEDLPRFASKHGLPSASPGESYPQYRRRLQGAIELEMNRAGAS